MASKPVIGIDLDGTILDCRPRQEAVLLHIFPELAPKLDLLWKLKRDGLSTSAALGRMNLAAPCAFSKKWMELIEAPQYLQFDKALPGTCKALENLSAKVGLHLITSRQNPSGVYETLRHLDFTSFFEEIVVVPVGRNAASAKARHLQKCDAIAHCGDTEVDGIAASIAGARFLAVTCGQRSEEFLIEKADAVLVFPSLYDVAQSNLVA